MFIKNPGLRITPLHLGIFLCALANIRLFFPSVSVSWDGNHEMWNYFRFMGSALREGTFPDFFPNIVSGYPLGANIQAGVYNIFYLLAAFLFPTSVYSVNITFLATHIFLYLTTYRIAETYGFDSKICLYAGLATLASGFLIGNASHMSYAAATLGLACCFLSIRLAISRNSRITPLLAGLGAYHSLTAGYPAITSFGAQVLFIYWIYQWVRCSDIRAALYLAAIGAAIGSLLSLPTLLHLLNQAGNWSRGSGVSISNLAEGSLPLSSLANFIVPALPSRLITKLADSPPDQTMVRFHLLFVSIAGVMGALLSLSDQTSRRALAPWLLVAIIATWLALGSNAAPPVRLWLAEHFFIYRLGRFPSGEHRGIALFALIMISAFGLSKLVKNFSWFGRYFIAVLIIDFLIVMTITHKMRSAALDDSVKLPASTFKTIYLTEDQKYIDAPRLCEGGPIDDPSQAGIAIETQREKLAPNRFFWSGYVNLVDQRYEREYREVVDVICGPSRLYRWPSRLKQEYKLDIYSPGVVNFTILESRSGEPQSSQFVWADYNDGYWHLTINGSPQPFVAGPAALRYFHAKAGDHVQMKYRGPLTRIFR